MFDGLRLLFDNDRTRIDTARTRFIEPEGLIDPIAGRININEVIPTQEWLFQGTLVPYDYEVRFSDELVGQSIGGFRLGTGGAAPTAMSR